MNAVSACLEPHVQARALGEALARLGFTAEVLSVRDHQLHPCVTVTSGPGRTVPGAVYVYAAPDGGGCWLFWRSSLADPLDVEPLAPVTDVPEAASAIGRELSRVAAVRRAG